MIKGDPEVGRLLVEAVYGEPMKHWRGLFPDHFIEVEADTEEEAERKMIELLKQQIESGEVKPIAWQDDPQRKPQS